MLIIVKVCVVLGICILFGWLYNQEVKKKKVKPELVYVMLIGIAISTSLVTVLHYTPTRIIRLEVQSKNFQHGTKLIGVRKDGKKVEFHGFEGSKKTIFLPNSNFLKDVYKQLGEDDKSLKEIKYFKAVTEDEK